MKHLIIVLIIFCCNGCTSLKSVELSPVEIQEKILTENIVNLGDSLKIITADGVRHEFEVTSITDRMISGKNVDILIVDIVALETREFSSAKTAALAGSTLLLYQVLAALATAVTLGL